MKKITLVLLLSFSMIAMEQEKLQAPPPPSGRASLVLAVSEEEAIPSALLRKVQSPRKEKKNSIPHSIIALQATQKFEPYDRWLSCAEVVAHQWTPNFITDCRDNSIKIAIGHYQDGTSYLLDDANDILTDAMSLASYVEKQGDGNPEAFAFAQAPLFNVIKNHYHCRSTQAILGMPAYIKACMNPVRWQMLKQFICFKDVEFKNYMARLEERNPRKKKRAKRDSAANRKIICFIWVCQKYIGG